MVANYYNDSVSLIDATTDSVVAEQDLRPGKIDPDKHGVPGGEYPLGVAWRDNSHAYVGAARDRELVALNIDRVHFEAHALREGRGDSAPADAGRADRLAL